MHYFNSKITNEPKHLQTCYCEHTTIHKTLYKQISEIVSVSWNQGVICSFSSQQYGCVHHTHTFIGFR